MKKRNPIVFLTATVTLMVLLVMGGSTLLPALALEAPPYYHIQWGIERQQRRRSVSEPLVV